MISFLVPAKTKRPLKHYLVLDGLDGKMGVGFQGWFWTTVDKRPVPWGKEQKRLTSLVSAVSGSLPDKDGVDGGGAWRTGGRMTKG